MKAFDLFLDSGDVKKQIPDRNLSNSLIKDSIKRLEYAKYSSLSNENAKYVYENVYDSLREAADPVLFLKGFKSFSHEATISFLQNFDEFSIGELTEFDRMRRKRNGMKYYGKSCSIEDVKEAIEFAENILKKIVLLQKKL